MPSDFLLPLFVLTLLANAVLVAFAIRAMQKGQWEDDRRLGAAPTRRPTEEVATGPEPSVSTQPPVEAQSPSSAPVRDAGTDVPGPAAAAPKTRRKVNSAPKPRRTTKPAAAANAPATRSAPAEPRRGRRRFSLPPLDDDHEKVNRSIKSFLGGIDGSEPRADGPDPATDAPERATDARDVSPTEAPPKRPTTAGPTTVALIAVDGIPVGAGRTPAVRPQASPMESHATDRTPLPTDGPESDPVAEALAMVERTLRAAARGSDVVTIADHGRFRIVLPATGELAARAYLRRIRATIEPRLESAGRPLRLAVATATVLDESVDHALRRAEDRLSLALASDGSPDAATAAQRSAGGSDDAPGHPSVRPRAAAD